MSGGGRADVGTTGELIAADHLRGLGWRILERGYRPTTTGELDLVAADPGAIVFCEVRTRVGPAATALRQALESVGPDKRRRLRRLAARWIVDRAGSYPARDALRFDVVAVALTAGGRLVALEHLENAF